jgi:amino acid transporter
MLNPFDISELRDFNLFFVAVGVFGSILGRMSWSGTQGYNAAARNAHEQKMGGILGAWCAGFSSIMIVLLAVVAYTYMNSTAFESGPGGSIAARTVLAQKAFAEIASDKKFDEIRGEYQQYLATGKISPLLQTSLDSVRDPAALGADGGPGAFHLEER